MAKRKKKPRKSKGRVPRRTNPRGSGTRLPPQISVAVAHARGVLAIWDLAQAYERELGMYRVVLARLEEDTPGFLEVFNEEFYKLAQERGLEVDGPPRDDDGEDINTLEEARASEPVPISACGDPECPGCQADYPRDEEE